MGLMNLDFKNCLPHQKFEVGVLDHAQDFFFFTSNGSLEIIIDRYLAT